jgi:hypothetical protein
MYELCDSNKQKIPESRACFPKQVQRKSPNVQKRLAQSDRLCQKEPGTGGMGEKAVGIQVEQARVGTDLGQT